MHEKRLKMLRIASLAPDRSAAELLVRVRAMDALAREDGRVPLELFRTVLIEACSNPYGSWEGTRAASMADRLLSFFDEYEEGDQLTWPSATPDAIADASYWHPDPDWADVDCNDTHADRDRWRTNIEGEPPWPQAA